VLYTNITLQVYGQIPVAVTNATVLTEHEFDHVMTGTYNDEPVINPDEVASWKWMDVQAVKDDIAVHPDEYTAWFKIIFDKFYQHIKGDK